MSGFSDDFMAGAGDLFEMFGEPATVTGPGGAAQSVVVVASFKPVQGEAGPKQFEHTQQVQFELDGTVLSGGPMGPGWVVTKGGVAYTVREVAVQPSGLTRAMCEVSTAQSHGRMRLAP